MLNPHEGESKRAKEIRREIGVVDEDDLIELGLADLPSFSRWPLGYHGGTELWKCQVEWQEIIQAHYEHKLSDPDTAKHLCLLAPSEHGKTNGVVIPFLLWALARNRNIRIIVAGSKDDLAEQIGAAIDRLVVRRADLLAKFGLVPAYPWNANSKFFQRDDDHLVHPSLLFIGPDSETQGQRADIIVCTDLFTRKNSRTPEARAKIMDWYYHTLMPRLEPNGFILTEGHHVNSEDGYTELEDDERFKIVRYKAILEEPSEENGGKGKVLAPEHWSFRQLAAIRQKKPALFLLIYQNMPIETTGIVNREVLERCLDRSRPLLYSAESEVRSAYAEIIIGVDPAFTINRWSKYSACLIFGFTQSGQRDLLGGWRSKLLPHQLRAKIVQTILAFNPHRVFIEANAAQVFLIKEVKESAAIVQYRDRIIPVYTTGGPDVESTVEEGISKIVSLIETGSATLPYAGQEAQTLVEALFTEVINFPTYRFTDVIMAWQILEHGMANASMQSRKVTVTNGMIRTIAKMRRGSRMGLYDFTRSLQDGRSQQQS